MATETSTNVEIDGTKYEIQMLGALKGRRVLARLGQVAAPSLRALASEENLGLEAGAAALAALLDKLDPDVLDELCNTFAETTRFYVNANTAPKLSDHFDQHFGRRYMAMMKWLAACLQFNFPDFLDDGPLTSLRGAMAASLSKSRTGSTGSSGGS